MLEDVSGAQADSPQPDAQAAPSAEPIASSDQVSEQGTPPSTQPEPAKPWNLPPEQRWEELRRERDEARRAYQDLATRASQPMPPVQPAQPQVDPWEGLLNHPDPATAQYWQMQRRLMEHHERIAEERAIQRLQPVIEAGRQELARMSTAEFRRQNPDIKPGSEEERSIVSYMSGQVDGFNHPLESAKRNVLFDKLEAENRALKGKQSSVSSKVSANNSESSSGISASAGLPRQPSDWRDQVRQAIRNGGTLADMVNAAGAQRVKE